MNQLLQFVLSGLLSWSVVLLILPFLRRYFLDSPNQRSSHSFPTPRGGGLSFVLVGSLMNCFFSEGIIRWIPIVCLPLSFVGLWDDWRNLPALFRYIVQALTGLGLLYVSNMSWTWLSVIFVIIFITSIINFFNFMDGLDGLVAGSACILFASISSWSISGAIFGFLLWNWSPAKVFMGDVGSTFLGAVFGGMILLQGSYKEGLSIFLLGFPLIADAVICLCLRFLRGEDIFKAHREHLFQRLNKAGLSHQLIASIYVSAVLLLVTARQFGGLIALAIALILEVIAGLIINAKFADRS